MTTFQDEQGTMTVTFRGAITADTLFSSDDYLKPMSDNISCQEKKKWYVMHESALEDIIIII